MPESDLDLLTDAARAAGEIGLRYWRQQPQVWDKPEGAGPVTEADLAVNDMLHQRLLGARPDYGWLSEESPDDARRLAAHKVFIVDPIDGTRAFIDRDASFAHSLAVAEGGKIVAAVVFLPAKDALYAADDQSPATLNGAPIGVSTARAVDGATVLTSKASLAADHWTGGKVPGFRRMFRASLAWRLCLVAEGRFDAMLTLRPTWEWDVAAGDLIARQAGARVTDCAGRPIRYNRPSARADGVIAAPPDLWSGLHRALRPAAAP